MKTIATRALRFGAGALGALFFVSPGALAQDAGPPATNDAQTPPSATPPVTTPPGAAPPDAAPPSATPPGATQPGALPPNAPQSGATAPGSTPLAPMPSAGAGTTAENAPAAESNDQGAQEAGQKKKKKRKNRDVEAGTLEGQEADDADGGRTVPGDPFGEQGGGAEFGPISLRAMVQARYAATFAAASTNPRPDYVVRENYLAQQGDGWGLNRFFLRIAGDVSE